MKKNICYHFIILILFILVNCSIPVSSYQDHVEGLEYDIRKINDVPLERYIDKTYDLYEIYFENRSSNTFSIQGYSIDLGINYTTLNDIYSESMDKSSKGLAVLNLATSAAGVALGGIAKSAANTIIRSVGSFKQKKRMTGETSTFLSSNKTYVLYPQESLSLFFFVKKEQIQAPNKIRFICRDEELNLNYILINNKIQIRDESVDQFSDIKEKDIHAGMNAETVISAPDSEQYK